MTYEYLYEKYVTKYRQPPDTLTDVNFDTILLSIIANSQISPKDAVLVAIVCDNSIARDICVHDMEYITDEIFEKLDFCVELCKPIKPEKMPLVTMACLLKCSELLLLIYDTSQFTDAEHKVTFKYGLQNERAFELYCDYLADTKEPIKLCQMPDRMSKYLSLSDKYPTSLHEYYAYYNEYHTDITNHRIPTICTHEKSKFANLPPQCRACYTENIIKANISGTSPLHKDYLKYYRSVNMHFYYDLLAIPDNLVMLLSDINKAPMIELMMNHFPRMTRREWLLCNNRAELVKQFEKSDLHKLCQLHNFSAELLNKTHWYLPYKWVEPTKDTEDTVLIDLFGWQSCNCVMSIECATWLNCDECKTRSNCLCVKKCIKVWNNNKYKNHLPRVSLNGKCSHPIHDVTITYDLLSKFIWDTVLPNNADNMLWFLHTMTNGISILPEYNISDVKMMITECVKPMKKLDFIDHAIKYRLGSLDDRIEMFKLQIDIFNDSTNDVRYNQRLVTRLYNSIKSMMNLPQNDAEISHRIIKLLVENIKFK